MLNNRFPKSTEWVESHFSQDRKQSYLEHLYAVKYHLGFAKYASSQVTQQVYQMPFASNSDGTTITLIRPEYYLTALLHQGDTAIREAASAFDTALCLVNDSVQLEVEKARVTWTRNLKQKCKLRQALEAAKFNRLIEAIDRLYASIGLERLYEYRNGVTHRGAPAILLPDDWSNTIPLPTDIVGEPDQDQKT